MDRKSHRDLFEIEDGRQFDLNRLPTGLLLDVMFVPAAAQPKTPEDVLASTT